MNLVHLIHMIIQCYLVIKQSTNKFHILTKSYLVIKKLSSEEVFSSDKVIWGKVVEFNYHRIFSF